MLLPSALRRVLLLCALLAPFTVSQAFAQSGTPGIDGGTGLAAVYSYVPPGIPAMEIDVWGAIRQPGRYRVPRTMELLDVLSVAGGPVIGTDEEGRTQEAIVRLSREGTNGRDLLFEAQLADVERGTAVPPPVTENDILSVQVRVRARLYWRDVLSVTTSVAALTLLFLNIFDRGN
ncbi:MAG: hypothetical protein AAFY55_08980 [Bacteroidota bacterium]